MKKMLTALSVFLTGLALAQVESQVVGYNTVELTQGATLLAVNFEGISSEAFTIQEAFLYTDGMKKGNSLATADNIQVLDSATGSYKSYYLSNGMNAKGTAQLPTFPDGKWLLSTETAASMDTFPTGSAVWYIARNAALDSPVPVTIAGQVANDATKSNQIMPGANLIANPYAADLLLNVAFTAQTGMVKGNTIASADNIQVMNGASWDTYYLSNGMNAKGTAQLPTFPDGKWLLGSATEASDSSAIPMGYSAWYISKGSQAFNVQFEKPYDL